MINCQARKTFKYTALLLPLSLSLCLSQRENRKNSFKLFIINYALIVVYFPTLTFNSTKMIKSDRPKWKIKLFSFADSWKLVLVLFCTIHLYKAISDPFSLCSFDINIWTWIHFHLRNTHIGKHTLVYTP